MRSTSVCAYVTARATSVFRRRGTTAPPTIMAAREILAGVLKPKKKSIPEITSSRILPRVTFLSERARVPRRARPVRLTLPIRLPTLDEPSRGTPREQAKQTDAGKQGKETNSSPSRPGLLPGAGRRRMTRRTFSGENAKILRRGGGEGGATTSPRLMGSGQRIGRFRIVLLLRDGTVWDC